jgi:hypothetical protein
MDMAAVKLVGLIWIILLNKSIALALPTSQLFVKIVERDFIESVGANELVQIVSKYEGCCWWCERRALLSPFYKCCKRCVKYFNFIATKIYRFGVPYTPGICRDCGEKFRPSCRGTPGIYCPGCMTKKFEERIKCDVKGCDTIST